jgi:hypothetical protein
MAELMAQWAHAHLVAPSMRFVGVVVVAAFLPLLIGVGFLVLINRGTGIKGMVVQPDCIYPVLTTPCQIKWLPLKAQVRIFGTTRRPDGIPDPGPLVTTVEAGTDGRFQIGLKPGSYFVAAYAIRNDQNWWDSMPMLVTVRPWSFENIRIEARGNPAAICLSATDRIDTPTGPVPVSQLRVGMIVWTLDATGHRAGSSVLLVSHRAAPLGHEILRLALADGRTVEASPGHPTADGRLLGDLRQGDLLDGSAVTAVQRVSYVGDTWDLLPAGATGFYWADGVLLGSTLGR